MLAALSGRLGHRADAFHQVGVEIGHDRHLRQVIPDLRSKVCSFSACRGQETPAVLPVNMTHEQPQLVEPSADLLDFGRSECSDDPVLDTRDLAISRERAEPSDDLRLQ
jgi:hypothetical protein